MELGLIDKVVLVTGATGAIGSEIADRFAAEGAKLVLVARNAAKLVALAEELKRRHGAQSRTIPADLATDAGLTAVTEGAGRTDSLVNNAGAIPGANLFDISL